MKLNATTIQNIKLPATGRIDISDDKTTGLKLRISASGHRSWSLTFKDCSGMASGYSNTIVACWTWFAKIGESDRLMTSS